MPSIEYDVNITEIKINGSKIGNDRTGYNVPFAPAFEIIAAIIVDAIANPMFERKNVNRNNKIFLIINSSNKAE